MIQVKVCNISFIPEPVDENLTDIYAYNNDQISTTEISQTDDHKKNTLGNDRNIIPQSMFSITS